MLSQSISVLLKKSNPVFVERKVSLRIPNPFRKINLYFFESEKISIRDFIAFYGFLTLFSIFTFGVILPILIKNLF